MASLNTNDSVYKTSQTGTVSIMCELGDVKHGLTQTGTTFIRYRNNEIKFLSNLELTLKPNAGFPLSN